MTWSVAGAPLGAEARGFEAEQRDRDAQRPDPDVPPAVAAGFKLSKW